MPWTRIGRAETVFATSASPIVCANVERIGAGGRVQRVLMLYDWTPLRWTEIGPGADYVLPCATTIVALGADGPGAVTQRLSDGTWEPILEGADRVYGGATRLTSASGEEYPVIYATAAGSGDVLAYQGPVRVRRHGHKGRLGPEAHPWVVIGGPAAKLVEAGPMIESRLTLYALAPDRQSVWEYTGSPRSWIRIGGPARDIVGGTANPPIAIQPETGTPFFYSGRPMTWTALGVSPNETLPYERDPDGRLLIDSNGSLVYLTSSGRLFVKFTHRGVLDRIGATRWTELGHADRAAMAAAGSLGLLKRDTDGSVWQWDFPTMTLVPVALPDAVEGQAYAATMRVLGGVPPYTWWIRPGLLPGGLRLDPGTVAMLSGPPNIQTSDEGYMNITGVPEVAAPPPPDNSTLQFPLTIVVDDSLGDRDAQTGSITWHDSVPPGSSRPTPTAGTIGFAQLEDPMLELRQAITIDPPYPAPGEAFTVSWSGKNYGDLPVSGQVEDTLGISDDSGTSGPWIYTSTAPGSAVTPGEVYPGEQEIDGLPEGRYTVTVDLQDDVSRIFGFNQTSVDLPIEDR